ncbi:MULTISPECIES: hypothetical protein [Winogradskyella]|uniref:hypothetical protein n=1 Tax=Winogradskyella TaxID=286104 RepID=UPI0015C91AB2|nr:MULTISPECIES: hypothetical protein [Winogradskyella]QXP79248.1 hypothetical protein H0I32_00935 [Winogradskyella sp. HaHa_3_26]
MTKTKYKKVLIVIAIIAIVTLLFSFVANTFVESKIESALNDLPKSVKIDYSEIDVALWSGDVEILTPKIVITGETTSKTILNATLKTIEVKDLSYWDYLFNDEISVEELHINTLVAKYLHNPVVKNNDYKNGFLEQIKQVINVESITINNADLLVSNYETDAVILSIPQLNFEVVNLEINPEASKTKDKITYGNFKLNTKSLKWATNAYDDILVDDIHFTNKNATFKGFKLKTKYSKSEYSSILNKERDHFNITIAELRLNDLNFGIDNDEKFYFNSEKVHLKSPAAEIYRDKLVADDTSRKLLYGRMIRELDFNLGLKSIEIENGKISYLEKVKVGEEAGRLDFTEMNAKILNLGNTFGDKETTIAIQTNFMKNSSLNVDWNFKVSDTTDQFMFKADLGVFNATQLAQFTNPNLNVDLTGELNQTYFTISGDPNTSRIDLKIKYDDFEVLILKKDGREKNNFLSTLVNLFVSKDSDEDKQNFRYGQSDQVNRDVTKSVFNFIWLNVKDGLLSAIAGDGEMRTK